MPNKIRTTIASTSLFIAICLISELAIASFFPASVHRSPISNHIDQPTITDIYRDSDGFLWVGTQQGLYRFDGESVIHFQSDDTKEAWIADTNIRGISEDHLGRVIVVTLGGDLYRWDKIEFRFIPLHINSQSVKTKTIGLFKDSKQNLWILSRVGLSVIHAANIEKYDNPFINTDLSEIGEISDISQDDQGTIYIATTSGLFSISVRGDQLAAIKLHKKIIGIRSLENGPPGTIFIGTIDGTIYKYNTNSKEIVSIKLSPAKEISEITDLLYIDDTLWIGTNNGIIQANSSLEFLHIYNQSNSKLSYEYITKLYKDDQVFWIGTYQGLDQLTSNSIDFFNRENSNIYNDIQAFEQDQNGNLWIGTYSGLYVFDQVSNRHESYSLISSDKLADRRIMTLAVRESNLWIGYRQNGVQILDLDSGLLRRPLPEATENYAITKILHASDGETWIATYNHGLFNFGGGRLKKHSEIKEESITILFETSKGELYAASEYSIYRYVEAKNKFVVMPAKFQNSSIQPMILSISEGIYGDLLVGTKDQGLFTLSIAESNIAKPVAKNSTLAKLTVYGALVDRDRTVWCPTEKGIFVLDQSYDVKFRLTKLDGLQGNDFNFGATFIDDQKQMYFGGVNGYNRLVPDRIEAKTSVPKIVINKIELPRSQTLFHHEIENIETLQLEHSQYFITFTFSIQDYLNPFNNKYRYQLENFDPDWIDNDHRNTATYTNLPPGEYKFRVIGANSSGIWNDAGASINIIVLPPAWLTWQAYCIYTSLFLVVLLGSKKIYDTHAIKNKAIEHAQEMYAEANRAQDYLQEQQDEQDELVNAIYGHNLATLELMRSVASTQRIDKHINALSLLEECYHYQPDGLVADMRRFTDKLISALIFDASVAPETITTINAVTNRLVPAKAASTLALILLELIHNALKHAFKNDSSANFVQIDLNIEEAQQDVAAETYELTVMDDGVGLPENFDPAHASSAGFATIMQLSTSVGGSFEVSTDNGTVATVRFTI